ncbi:MAG: DUF4430 domain-containing protein [Solirubrobacterales bacterium]
MGEEEGVADLSVTRDYGSRVLLEDSVGPLSDSSTAMRLLDQSAEIETSYGGAFVDSIDSISSSSGTRSSDWFYFVNGIAAERGAAEFVVEPGDQMWWDHRDWTDAMDVNAVVGSFPAPLSSGYDGNDWPVSVECLSVEPACEKVEERLADAGVDLESASLAGGSQAPATRETIRVLVGRWSEVGADEEAARLDLGPSKSGVFAGFITREGQERLIGLDVTAKPVVDFGAHSGLIAAMRRGDGPPVWLVTGTDERGVQSAAAGLQSGQLHNRYAAATSPEGVYSLPAEAG